MSKKAEALSKQFLLRLTPSVYESLATKADSLDLSVNMLLNKIIECYLSNEINLEVTTSPELAELADRVSWIETHLSTIKLSDYPRINIYNNERH